MQCSRNPGPISFAIRPVFEGDTNLDLSLVSQFNPLTDIPLLLQRAFLLSLYELEEISLENSKKNHMGLIK